MPGEAALRRIGWAGAAGGVVALVAVALVSGAAWRAWLAAGFVWSAGPIGAVGWLMIMRLIPGRWAEELSPLMEAQALLLPLAALLMLPALIAYPAVYGWAMAAPEAAFPAAWLSGPGFLLRSAVWFAGLIGLVVALVLQGRRAPAWSCVGLVFYVTFGTFIAVDWLLSLDAEFASSGFGLYVLCIQMLQALVIGIAVVLAEGVVQRPGPLGGLMLTLLLLWMYFAFMHYVITWSDNLPPGVRWYQARTGGGWDLVMWAVAASRIGPAFLLLFAHVRRSPGWLLALSGVVTLGAICEAAWLTLPAVSELPPAGALDGFLYVAASLAMSLSTFAALRLVLRRRAA